MCIGKGSAYSLYLCSMSDVIFACRSASSPFISAQIGNLTLKVGDLTLEAGDARPVLCSLGPQLQTSLLSTAVG